jgi:hypothetical protein
VRLLVAVLALAATIFAVAGGSAMLLERRLTTLAPGGVTLGAVHYNALTGRLALGDVRARDAAGREVFRADSVLATANPFSLLAGTPSLGRVRVAGPRLTLRAGERIDLEGVTAGLGAAHAFLGSAGPFTLPLRVHDLVIGDGVLTIEGAGKRGSPLVVRDLDLRLSRLTTAAVNQRDVAFAIEMAVYGTTVYATGQPRGAGYVVHVRARGLDAPALARDFPVAGLGGIERGQAEIDADVLLTDGRVLTSGLVRLSDAVVALPLSGRPRLRAATIAVVAEALDVVTGGGRITRLDLGTPSLALPVARAGATLTEVLAPLRAEDRVVVRRISITDGTLALNGPAGVRLTRVQLAAHLPERRPDSGWVVSGRAVVDGDAEVSVDGLVARDLRALDAVTRLSHVPLAWWRALAGAGAQPGWDGRVSFDGRLRLVAREGEAVATAAGQAELRDVRDASTGSFRAERIALGIRQLHWPSAEAVFDRVVLTRPAFGLSALAAWAGSLVTSEVSVVDGEMRGDAPGRTLHDLAVDLAPDDRDGVARLRLSASTDFGGHVALDRVVAYTAAVAGLPLGFIASTLDEAARAAAFAPPFSAPPPSALPSAVTP